MWLKIALVLTNQSEDSLHYIFLTAFWVWCSEYILNALKIGILNFFLWICWKTFLDFCIVSYTLTLKMLRFEKYAHVNKDTIDQESNMSLLK